MTVVTTAPLRIFIRQMTDIMQMTVDERGILPLAEAALTELVATDNWLPDEYAQPDPKFYRQYLLHCDPLERFSVVSFVWGPGQRTPIHDHTVWGLVGVLRGAEIERRYDFATGRPVAGEETRLDAGSVVRISSDDGDVHQVSNGLEADVSVSIHVYGANIGKVTRHVFDAETGAPKPFISGYSNQAIPNVWL
jgi:predicted metal-dependent enzyme (double-stranded beta helix superfamily)